MNPHFFKFHDLLADKDVIINVAFITSIKECRPFSAALGVNSEIEYVGNAAYVTARIYVKETINDVFEMINRLP
jgi:hypothetical protein